MKLDELLERESTVPRRSAQAREATRSALVTAAHDDIARRARIVRRRRRALIACAAVIVGGVTAVSVRLPDGSSSRLVAHAPEVNSASFRTVAAVIDAAAAAAPLTGPGDAPFWKVVLRVPVNDCGQNRCKKSWDRAIYWMGLNKPGAQSLGALGGKPFVTVADAPWVSIDGHRMTWGEANAKTWTDAQLRTIQFEGYSPAHGPWLSVPAWYRTGYNTASALIDAPASPAIRKQLWKILGSIPELQFKGHAKDALGRSGWKLALPSAGGSFSAMSYIIDTSSGLMLQYESLDSSGYEPVTVLSAGPADSAPKPTCPVQANGQGVSTCVVPAR